MTVRYIVGDTRDVVATLPDGSVDLVITSPPFLALRSYLPADHPDKAKELGSEPNPAAFIDMLLALTAEWRRVLAPHGTLAVELGDTYSGSGGGGGDYLPGGLKEGQPGFGGSAERQREGNAAHWRLKNQDKDAWPLAKSQALIPELYRIALAYGINPLTGQESPAGRWRVRNTVTWCRPNPPVGFLGDKFRPSTSDLVIACTSERRWFDLDAVRVPHLTGDRVMRQTTPTHDPERREGGHGMGEREQANNPAGAPPLDHWIIPPGGYSGSHYAVFPPALVEKPIEACCPRRVCRTCGTPSVRQTKREYRGRGDDPPKVLMRDRKADGVNQWDGSGDQTVHANVTTTGWSSCDCPGTDGIRLDGYHTGTGWRPGMVLDPFGGSGTTGVVASGWSRDCTLIDLDERNADLARERLGMFLEVETHQADDEAA